MTSKVYTVGDRYGRERTVIASGLDVIAKCEPSWWRLKRTAPRAATPR
jgi:hypothetical protein